jgi:hypothetical protein
MENCLHQTLIGEKKNFYDIGHFLVCEIGLKNKINIPDNTIKTYWS